MYIYISLSLSLGRSWRNQSHSLRPKFRVLMSCSDPVLEQKLWSESVFKKSWIRIQFQSYLQDTKSMYNYEIRFLLLEGRIRIRFVSRAKSGFLSMVGSGQSQSGFETLLTTNQSLFLRILFSFRNYFSQRLITRTMWSGREEYTY